MLVPRRGHEIPEEAVQVAQAAFPKGNRLMTLRDALGPIFEDEAFTELYPSLGQPAESPGRLALVTVLQFMEQLTDREAADAVRGRIDWKYALGLELRDSGFHYSVLTEFRQRLVGHQATQLLLDRILERCQEKGLLKGYLPFACVNIRHESMYLLFTPPKYDRRRAQTRKKYRETNNVAIR